MELASVQYSVMVLDKISVVTLGSDSSTFNFISPCGSMRRILTSQVLYDISLSLYNSPAPSYSSNFYSV